MHPIPRRLPILPHLPLFAVLAVALLTACRPSGQSGQPGTSAKAGLRVVATTSMIADAARNVAGSRAEVTALMGEGVDPHVYKASPGDVRLLEAADLILYNGLHLEGRMADTLTQIASRRPVVRVTETIPETDFRSPPEFEGHFDPHVWFDPTLWVHVVERTRDALIERDPANKDEYEANAAKHIADLRTLHDWTKQRVATIPEGKRVLVTAHDAFGYFGKAYGVEVLGVQGISTDSETSIETIRSLVSTLVDRRIPAVFIESSVSHKAVESLIEGAKARGHTLAIGGELFSDAMGAAGTPEGTYLGMVRHNVGTLVKALGGTIDEASPASSGRATSDAHSTSEPAEAGAK